MAWLQGSSTWANIESDIAKLLCGEINDGVGNNAGSDAWLRDISTSFSTLRTPAAVDVSLPAMSNRAGYFALVRNAGGVAGQLSGQPGMSPSATVCQVQAPYTSLPGSPAHNRVLVWVQVAVANTVANNYSTAQINWIAFDADNALSTLAGASPTLASTGIVTLGTGLQIKLTDPSGFLQVGTYFVRGFTSGYLYGIDSWPWYPNRSATPTWTTAPPGTAGTDYDIIDQVCVGVTNPTIDNLGGTFNNPLVRGAWFSGLGIKTATGNSGALYTTNVVKCAAQKIAIVKSVSGGNGVLDLIFGPAPQDAVVASGIGGGIRPSHCMALGSWLKFASTSASVTNAMIIQYWISVKPTGISIVLNADPGQTGKLGCAGVWKMDNVVDPTNDLFPWVCTNTVIDMSSGNYDQTLGFWTPYNYESQKLRATSISGVRDWQTGWMRTDFYCVQTSSNWNYFWGMQGVMPMGARVDGANPTTQQVFYNPTSNPVYHPGIDGSWDLFGLQLIENVVRYGGSNTGTSIPASFQASNSQLGSWVDNNGPAIRGSLTTYAFMIPPGGWGNGDELTDSVSGAKYFLISPDYAGMPGKLGIGGLPGGVAVRENL